MAKYKYEFEREGFEPGDCYDCPFSYESYGDGYGDWYIVCVFGCGYDECVLEEVE